MSRWSKEIEDELAVLLKDWLKHKRKTQSDLQESLKANSSRMNCLMEVLQKDYSSGGIAKVAAHLCSIENDWSKSQKRLIEETQKHDPFNQLDLLLEEIRVDCDS